MNYNKALVIVDAQRGFMPEEEGERLGVPGFGELTVPGGHEVIRPINAMAEIFVDHEMTVVTTQDMHPETTAHFADEPNFTNTWPRHCVAGTPGAKLHPKLYMAQDSRVIQFVKGDTAAATPEDDDSYSGALAHRTHPETGERELLPDYLRKLDIVAAYVCGLTVGKERPLCVDSTAMDLYDQGFKVVVVTDAVRAVVPEDAGACFKRLEDYGVCLETGTEAVAEVAATPEVIR
jgi:nicotinamidase/pyrazinamidase